MKAKRKRFPTQLETTGGHCSSVVPSVNRWMLSKFGQKRVRKKVDSFRDKLMAMEEPMERVLLAMPNNLMAFSVGSFEQIQYYHRYIGSSSRLQYHVLCSFHW
ncbi:uncharacterized protein LOC111323400 [Stylophora pistillata]|uniref:uncharacterized protein LOC111323400 n=1 Tax=Stylophora pistillata TaxID=50429 RepID=UPI000C03B8C1|nr:uncharacterized protein LOC111323400 [Stylophora pistillata]